MFALSGGDNDGLSCRGHHKSPFTNPAEYLVGPGDGNSHRYIQSGKSLEVYTVCCGYLGKESLNLRKGLTDGGAGPLRVGWIVTE